MSEGNKKNKRKIEHWELVSLLLMIYDFIAILVSYLAALWLRFDCRFDGIQKEYIQTYFRTAWIYAAFCIVVFWFLRLYKSIWRFASYTELIRVIIGTVLTGVIYFIGVTVCVERMPVSYYVFGIIIQFCLTLGVRFAYRFVLLLRGRRNENVPYEKRVMLIGAGSAGQMIFRDIKHAKETSEKVYCFIDDNENKWGRYIDDVPVFGGRERIMEAVAKFGIEKIYVAIPSAKPEDKREILRVCNETNCELMNLPGMYQLYTGEVSVSKMKPVQIEDLLGRDPIKTDMDEVFRYITGKVVLVTGVGSIGSELARQIAAHDPKHLILFDIYENNAYDIQQELRKKYPNLKLDTIIGSVRDSRKIFKVFEDYRPEIVYHAAAHKHVPLMETSPNEAIKNNVFGTFNVANAAGRTGTERMVLISTDKAVNPTNIMGASKRICEMIIQGMQHRFPATNYVAVRFGNVLGSNGSVIPLFKKQIAEGGPVTVTDKNIIRYFMTIPEAVSLVLQAGAYAKGGEIFVLDMGEPVKIDDMARNLIRLSGYEPDVDIPIVYTGLRPGEKMFEECLKEEEGLQKTANDLIFIGKPIDFDRDEFFEHLADLKKTAYEDDPQMKLVVEKLVPSYRAEK